MLQQFLTSLPPTVKSFGEACSPQNVAEACGLADLCFEISAKDSKNISAVLAEITKIRQEKPARLRRQQW